MSSKYEKVQAIINDPNRFERTTCGRCGGTGQYSYCSMYGSVCFGCGGAGWKFTKRGAAANAFFNDLCSKPVSELKVGDKIREDRLVNPMQGSFARVWGTVTEIKPNEDGTISYTTDHKTLGRYGMGNAQPTSMVRVAQTAEAKQEFLKKALEFQKTLTKSGKPMKKASKQ